MQDFVFITGNQNKADYLARFLGRPVEHVKVDLDEIQSLSLEEIVRHKLRQAYDIVKRPVVVEDAGLEFTSLGRLPGPLIKWFLEELGYPGTAALLDGKDRSAIARCRIGYYDGTEEVYFEGSLTGRIADDPQVGGGYGFDPLFIQDGYDVTRAFMNQEDHDRTYFELKPFGKLKEYLENKNTH